MRCVPPEGFSALSYNEPAPVCLVFRWVVRYPNILSSENIWSDNTHQEGSEMADIDILIKGGTVVDGTRVPRYQADVWIKDGKIAQIGGRVQGFAKKTI